MAENPADQIAELKQQNLVLHQRIKALQAALRQCSADRQAAVAGNSWWSSDPAPELLQDL